MRDFPYDKPHQLGCVFVLGSPEMAAFLCAIFYPAGILGDKKDAEEAMHIVQTMM